MIGVAYTWRALQKAFFTDRAAAPPMNIPKEGWPKFEPITWPEDHRLHVLAVRRHADRRHLSAAFCSTRSSPRSRRCSREACNELR